MGGGIIINRFTALLPAVTDPSFYSFLSDKDKARVDSIKNAGPAACTQKDIKFMARALYKTA